MKRVLKKVTAALLAATMVLDLLHVEVEAEAQARATVETNPEK